MIIGDKNYFAIEFQINNESYGVSLYGQCCFWAGEKKLGNYELVTRLGDVFSDIHGIVKDCGKRNSNWIERDAQEIFHDLNKMLYLKSYEGETYDDLFPAAYNVCINTESFDRLKIFLLDCDILTSRLIYSEDDGLSVNEVRLVPGEFDSVIKRFYLELEKLDQKFRNDD